ncbi:MAG: PilC/PilY family type IV pilus protein [Aromatoleum sp.]|uniref:pilus assembly protein n=1 Tax=Aromatoleum sp. TaxID=2307007 RepID=UPI0028939B40|nr:PilC/PilY family type IV pilus protein [Aromatoleum sp.]MDT3669281.1 PilC/PilY family type IV pilus protein [Aromatoleum sp.]
MLIALGFSWPATAEDIDIFNENPDITGTRPNVLLVLNNSSSMNGSTTLFDGSKGNKLEMIRQVLNTIIDPDNNLKNYGPCTISGTTRSPTGCITPGEVKKLLEGINLGLMTAIPSNATGRGTYVRSHIRPMNTPENRKALLDKINPSILFEGGDFYGVAMYEAYQYFGGKAAYVGFNKDVPFDDAAAQAGISAQPGSKYISPATLENQCADNYIIFIAEGTAASGEDKDATALLKNSIGGSTTPINFSPNNYTSSTLDEYARALHKLDVIPSIIGTQTVTTYTISVQTPEDNNFNNSGPTSARELLKSAAVNGGGEFFLASNAQAAMKAFINMLQKMQAINTVFAAVTLPVSVNVRGTFLNQVYMGQFRPDKGAKPRWPGNLKLYQITLDANNQPILADRNGDGVEDTVNGFLLPDKTSFWTTSSNYWTFDEMGNPASSSDAPDGAIVEKGGAAQRLRSVYATSQSARKLYTCDDTCAANASFADTPFSTSNTTLASNAKLGADDATRTALINWVRGEDNKDNEDANGVATDVRARIHGDLLHSRPAVVNYNRTVGDRDIVVYYGTNGGVFHAVKGGTDDADGFEKWGIVFPEFLSNLKRLRDNSPIISTADRKPYFADGPVSVYQKDGNSDGKLSDISDKVYLYVGMRRGGRFMYALDVSNPDNPKHLWKIDNSGSFAELGQTWSSPRPARISAVADDPVVIFGAGYDAENEDLSTARVNDKGRGIFIVNGRTGTLVKHIKPDGMGSVPADVTVVDRDNNGIHDRIYAVDTKGNVWRTDINDTDPAKWETFKIAALASSGAANARKFLNKPDVVFGKTYDAILVGSGDRENPFDTTVVNRFYMLRDTKVGFTGGLLCGTIEAPTTCTESDLEDVTGNPHQDSPLTTGSKGWYMTMATGEKIVGNAITVFGTTFFGTNRPTPPQPGACTSNLGEAKLYSVGFETGNATRDLNADGVIDSNDRSEVIEGGGYLPSPVYAPVEINKDNKKEKVDTVCIGPNCFGPGGKSYSTDRIRTYWRLQQ